MNKNYSLTAANYSPGIGFSALVSGRVVETITFHYANLTTD